jgi:pantothenate synthetase
VVVVVRALLQQLQQAVRLLALVALVRVSAGSLQRRNRNLPSASTRQAAHSLPVAVAVARPSSEPPVVAELAVVPPVVP